MTLSPEAAVLIDFETHNRSIAEAVDAAAGQLLAEREIAEALRAWRLSPVTRVRSAKVAERMHHASRFGAVTGSVTIDMAKVRQRRRDMVKELEP